MINAVKQAWQDSAVGKWVQNRIFAISLTTGIVAASSSLIVLPVAAKVLLIAGMVEGTSKLVFKRSVLGEAFGSLYNAFNALALNISPERRDIAPDIYQVVTDEKFGESLFEFATNYGASITNFHEVLAATSKLDILDAVPAQTNDELISDSLSHILEYALFNLREDEIVRAIIDSIANKDLASYMVNILKVIARMPDFPRTVAGIFESILVIRDPNWWQSLDHNLWTDAFLFEETVNSIWRYLIADVDTRDHLDGLERYMDYHRRAMSPSGRRPVISY